MDNKLAVFFGILLSFFLLFSWTTPVGAQIKDPPPFGRNPNTLKPDDLSAAEAICLHQWGNTNQDPTTGGSTEKPNKDAAVQCARCAMLAAGHRIPTFTAASCNQVSSSPGVYNPGTDAQAQATMNGAYCREVCATQPDLVPNQDKIAAGQITVTDAGNGQYSTNTKIIGQSTLGVTCGLPEVGLDGDTRVQSCCDVRNQIGSTAVEVVKSVPHMLCPPGWLRGATSLLRDFSSGVGASISLIPDIAHGNWKKAGLDVLKITPGIGPVTSYLQHRKDVNKEVCLTDVAAAMGVKALSAFPILTTMNDPGNANQFARACTDNAIPAIDQFKTNDDGTEKYEPTRNVEDFANAACKCVYPQQAMKLDDSLCKRYLTTKDNNGQVTSTSPDYTACVQCANNYGMWTGIGCINTGPTMTMFVNSLLAWGLGMGGGFATLCIMYSAFILQTSRGNPEKIKRSRDYLNSCLIGLGVIIFAVLILQIIGVDLLKIPGFSR